jgi:CDP-glucose 4,6-dehydratase
VIELARRAYGKGEVEYGDGTEGPHESAWLALEIAKAARLLGVTPTLTLAQAVERTMAWYRAHGAGADARALCDADISDFESLALKRCAATATGV